MPFSGCNQWVILSKHDSTILLAQIANHSTGFDSFRLHVQKAITLKLEYMLQVGNAARVTVFLFFLIKQKLTNLI